MAFLSVEMKFLATQGKIHWKIFLITAILVIIFVGWISSSLYAWKTYTNVEGGYAFQYPKEWNAVTNKYNSKNALFGPGATDESGYGGVEFYGTLSQSQSLKDFVKKFNAGVEAGATSETEITINGKTAIVSILSKASLESTETKSVSFENKGKVFAMYFMYKTDFAKYPEDKQRLAIFDQILSTFRFLEYMPSVTITSPKGGELWITGSVHTISWTTKNIPSANKISITLRRIPPPPLQAEGQEFDPIVFVNLPNTGSAEWTIADMYPTGTYVMGVNSYYSVPITDIVSAESAPFQISHSQIIGGAKDAHGCLIAAGYSWCGAKQSCVRSWETYCTSAVPKTAVFVCSGSKTVTATFYITDDKYVDLELSDGRKLSVPHAISASGARYANADESFVFWNKGDTAFITENGATTFTDCVIQ